MLAKPNKANEDGIQERYSAAYLSVIQSKLMNPFYILGKRFNEVAQLFTHGGKEGRIDSIEEWEQQEYCVCSSDNSIELKLNENEIIEVVFIFKPDKYQSFLKFDSSTPLGSMNKLFGTPTSSREQREVRFLGTVGASESYEMDGCIMHIEHHLDSQKVKTVTLMLPDVAP